MYVNSNVPLIEVLTRAALAQKYYCTSGGQDKEQTGQKRGQCRTVQDRRPDRTDGTGLRTGQDGIVQGTEHRDRTGDMTEDRTEQGTGQESGTGQDRADDRTGQTTGQNRAGDRTEDMTGQWLLQN